METHMRPRNGNSDGQESKRSVLTKLLGRLLEAKDKLIGADDMHLNSLLKNLSETENGLEEYEIDRFIQPEYPQFPADGTISPDPSDGNNKKYRKPPYEYVDTDWHLGWTDGRCGQS